MANRLMEVALDRIMHLDAYTPMGYTANAMPIYEYACSACGHRFEKLVRSISGGHSDVACPLCREQDAERAVSTFAMGGGASAAFEGAVAPSLGAG